MNNYICTFNYQNEVTRLETEAENRDNAFSKTISVMAKKYSKSRESMLLYFNGEKIITKYAKKKSRIIGIGALSR